MGQMAQDMLCLPEFLMDMLGRQYDPDVVTSIVEGSQGGRATALRANSLKTTPEALAGVLDAAGLAYTRPSWSDCAFCLPAGSEDAVRSLGAYEQGELYLHGRWHYGEGRLAALWGDLQMSDR